MKGVQREVRDELLSWDERHSGESSAGVWSETRLANLGVVNFDLAPDGKRIAAIVQAEESTRRRTTSSFSKISSMESGGTRRREANKVTRR